MSKQRLVVIGLERTDNVWRVAVRGHRWTNTEAQYVETIVYHEVSNKEGLAMVQGLANIEGAKVKLQFRPISMDLEIIDEVQ